MMRLIYSFVFFIAVQFSLVHAEPDNGALDKFVVGDYEQSAALAEGVGGAKNFALAARALNASAYLENDDKTARKIAKRAREFAKLAIEADEALVEGHLQYAIAIAQRASRMSGFRAFLSGSAGKARDALDAALVLEPDNAWALSSSAAWHLGVARLAGDGRFGSDAELGHQQFLAAQRLDPENISIAYEAALRLIAYGREDWREAGIAALAATLEMQPATHFDRALQERAAAFDAAIDESADAERAFIEGWS